VLKAEIRPAVATAVQMLIYYFILR